MDTSALMMPVELDVRVFDELDRVLGLAADAYELVAPRAVVEELEALATGGGEEAVAASVGSDLAADRCRTVETEASYADDALVELAERGECDYVVTNDRPLRDRVLERGVRVIGIRGRNRLHITEP
ncbi:PIN domain-containing protein [Halegenticoccus tardaugens]|uniref:PIN domain-containing protein n=1 Tax=Halegenticoccus tardaugens TaxID=2071624 RepID=UPI00100BB9C8|nr:PIN domain-containing protein [Halegenticoccus tardaugens]